MAARCKVLTNKEIYDIVKKPTVTETIRLHTLRWFGHAERVEGNKIPKRLLYMNLESKDQEVDQETDGKMK
jgi:hypothetical protein